MHPDHRRLTGTLLGSLLLFLAACTPVTPTNAATTGAESVDAGTTPDLKRAVEFEYHLDVAELDGTRVEQDFLFRYTTEPPSQ